MSMVDEGEIGLSAEEQAQFDSMRSEGSNANSPAELVPNEPAAAAVVDGTAAPDKGATAEPAATGEDEDGVETIKDASGKEVLDASTGKPQKRVSFHKYQRLQQKFDEQAAALGKTAEERARIDERLKIINEALMTPAPAAAEAVDEDPEPDPEQNIFEHNKWLRRQMVKQGESFTEFQNQIREQEEGRQMADSYRQDANKFARSEPHFGAAYHFLLSLRSNQLRAAGWTDDTKISQQIVKEEQGLVRNALSEKQSPAKRLFEMAKAAGFTPAPPALQPKPEDKVPGTALGAMPAAAPAAGAAPAAKLPTVSEQVALAAEGAAAAVSLSNAGGGATEPLTQAKLLSMDEDEFAAVVASLPKSKLRELFGD